MRRSRFRRGGGEDARQIGHLERVGDVLPDVRDRAPHDRMKTVIREWIWHACAHRELPPDPEQQPEPVCALIREGTFAARVVGEQGGR